MESPFPMIAGDQPVDSVVKLLSKSNPAVLVQENGTVQGIVTRSDMLHFMMSTVGATRMKITVLMGGASSERNVSLASGIRIVLALRGRAVTM